MKSIAFIIFFIILIFSLLCIFFACNELELDDWVNDMVNPAPEINVKQGSTDLIDGSGIFDFGDISSDGDEGEASDYIEFTIENLGNADLDIESIGITAGDSKDFDFDITSLSTEVSAPGSTSFFIRFDPLTTGEKNAEVIIINNDTDEGAYTFTIRGNARDPFTNFIQKIKASDPQVDDCLGYSVSISGDYAIIGARFEDGGAGDPMSNAGAAYIFHRTGTNTWDSGTKLVAYDAQNYDCFGHSVSISDNYAIVAAKHEDGGDGDPMSNAGAAYIFHRTGTNTWDSGTKIVSFDPEVDGNFGKSVSISGNYAIVGAYLEDGGAGAAYIFHRTGTNTWDSGIKIVAADSQADDNFGYSVSISGDYAIVGARFEDGGDGDPKTDAGAAYIFHRTGTNTWDTGIKIASFNPEIDGNFGKSVSISGDYAIVGAYHEDGGPDDSIPQAGVAYIFHRTGTNIWDTRTRIVACDDNDHEYDCFGYSVSINGDYAIVGAFHEDGGPGDPIPDAGAAYIFHRTGTNTWDSGIKIFASDPQDDDWFGCSVSISGNYAIVGAYLEDGGPGNPMLNAGAAYVFE